MHFLFFPTTIMPDADTSKSANNHPIGVLSPKTSPACYPDIFLLLQSIDIQV